MSEVAYGGDAVGVDGDVGALPGAVAAAVDDVAVAD
jgi:hypothetical protein